MAGLILLFDGECRLCCAHVRFVIPRDPAGRIRFAAMQSPVGQALLREFGAPVQDFTTVLVLDGDRLLERSAAILRVLAELGTPWPIVARLAGVVPRPLRDAAYDLVARWRFRLFGRRDSCLVPSPEIASRFLE